MRRQVISRSLGTAGRRAGLVGGILALVVLHVMLTLPNHLDRITPAAFLRLPLELPVILAMLALARGHTRRAVVWICAVAIALATVLRVADMAAFEAFGRPFNPILDFHLLGAAMNLLTGAVGRAWAVAAAAGAVAAVASILLLAAVAVRSAGRLAASAPRRGGALALAAVVAAWAGLHVAGTTVAPRLPLASLEAARSVERHSASTLASLGDLAAFEAVAATDPWREATGDRLLRALEGKDVIVAFVESYGRSAIDDPRYGPAVGAVLDRGSAALAAAGVEAVSGYLTSPTVGGMSWLAHGTLLSGLWVDNQRRYDSLMISERMTLNQAFRKAGWRTVAVMPAIVMAWPEGAFYGYDRIYPAADLGYRGKPFNWVTMPDQFTWTALRRLELDVSPRRPVMAEVALISSHAPWTPVPRLLPWDAIDDGRVFDDMASEGDPPNVVWRDPERVRRQFRLSVEYALQTAVSYATTFDMRDTVLVILGDHQPAPMITGEDAGRDVPVHVLSGDPAVIRAIGGWGYTPGLRPADDAPVWRMDEFRDRFLDAFSPHPPAAS